MAERDLVIEKLKMLAGDLHRAGCKSREDFFHNAFTDALLDIYDEWRQGKAPNDTENINAIEDYYFTLYQDLRKYEFNPFESVLLYEIEFFVYTLRRLF